MKPLRRLLPVILLVGGAFLGLPPHNQEPRAQADENDERLARVTGAGRKMEKQRDPEGYKKLEEEVEKAIRRGAAWLKKQKMLEQLNLNNEHPTLGILALLHAGEFGRDPV